MKKRELLKIVKSVLDAPPPPKPEPQRWYVGLCGPWPENNSPANRSVAPYKDDLYNDAHLGPFDSRFKAMKAAFGWDAALDDNEIGEPDPVDGFVND